MLRPTLTIIVAWITDPHLTIRSMQATLKNFTNFGIFLAKFVVISGRLL